MNKPTEPKYVFGALACPWCCSDNYLIFDRDHIHCEICECNGPQSRPTEAQAKALWNGRRGPVTSPPEETEWMISSHNRRVREVVPVPRRKGKKK